MEAASHCRRMLLQAEETASASPEAQLVKEETVETQLAGAEGQTIVAVAMGAVARFAVAAGWRRAVQRQLDVGRRDLDREVGALASLARWNLSSRAAMKEWVLFL